MIRREHNAVFFSLEIGIAFPFVLSFFVFLFLTDAISRPGSRLIRAAKILYISDPYRPIIDVTVDHVLFDLFSCMLQQKNNEN